MTGRRLTTAWFDLDATLYAADTGLWAEIGNRIEGYLRDVMGVPADGLLELKQNYFMKYGTTLRGLQLNNSVDTQDYLNYVHNIPVRDYLRPDFELRSMLLGLPLNRWVFTNSDRAHTDRVLKALGIEDCFLGWITVESIDFQCKPNREAYDAALKLCGESQFENIIFLDDSTRNLQAARDLGVFTILVGSESSHPSADISLARPHDLTSALPELFRRWSR